MGRKTLKLQQERANKIQEFTSILQSHGGCSGQTKQSGLNNAWKEIVIENQHLCVRDISKFERKHKSERNYVLDFYRFMFAKFKYPMFFNNVILEHCYQNNTNHNWQNPNKEANYKSLHLFFYIASGKSLYREIFKYAGFTKRETVDFINCPSSINSFNKAILFCIIRGNVADNNIAKQYIDIFSSRLEDDSLNSILLDNILFIIKHPNYVNEASLEKIFIENRIGYKIKSEKSNIIISPEFKFIKEMITFFCKYDIAQIKDNFIELFDYFSHLEYKFSFKNRTLNSIIQLCNAWHQERIIMAKGFVENREWKELLNMQGENIFRGWIIEELCTSNQLVREGNRMSHCVASYVSKCIEGKCHIFSIYNNIIYERATIEVVGKKIIQIRGKFNAAPSKSCLQAIRDWAMRYQLTKSGYINW
jgi:hypothetical protein